MAPTIKENFVWYRSTLLVFNAAFSLPLSQPHLSLTGQHIRPFWASLVLACVGTWSAMTHTARSPPRPAPHCVPQLCFISLLFSLNLPEASIPSFQSSSINTNPVHGAAWSLLQEGHLEWDANPSQGTVGNLDTPIHRNTCFMSMGDLRKSCKFNTCRTREWCWTHRTRAEKL